MRIMTSRGLVATAVVLAAITACQDGTAPGNTTFDSQRVMTGTGVVQDAVTAPGVRALEQVMRLGGTSAAPALAAAATGTGMAVAALRIAQEVFGAQAFAASVLSPTVLGRTFVFDSAAGRYVLSARTGAPANGVRIVLYAETAVGAPIVGQEVGYAELTDEAVASATSTGVRLVVVTGGMTRLSYGVTLSLPGVPPQVAVQGFIGDASDRLEFTIAESASTDGSGRGMVIATLRAPGAGMEVHATIEGAPDGTGKVALVVTSASDRIEVSAATLAGQVDASFTVNGKLLARASGAASAPAVRGENGRALNSDEQQALRRIVGMASGIGQLLGALVAPAGVIVQVATTIGR